MHSGQTAATRFRCHQKQKALAREAGLDSQTLAALGAACVDDSAAAAGLHTNEETVGTCATDFGWLVSAFHGIPNGPCDEASMRTGLKANLYQLAGWSYLPDTVRATADYHKLYQSGQHLAGIQLLLRELRARSSKMWIKF